MIKITIMKRSFFSEYISEAKSIHPNILIYSTKQKQMTDLGKLYWNSKVQSRIIELIVQGGKNKNESGSK